MIYKKNKGVTTDTPAATQVYRKTTSGTPVISTPTVSSPTVSTPAGTQVYRKTTSGTPVISTPTVSTPVISTPAVKPTAPRLPGIPADLVHHYWLTERDFGPSRKLLGTVHFCTVFVTDSDSRWTPEDKADYRRAAFKAIDMLQKAAAGYGASLSIDHYSLTMELSRDQEDDWYSHLGDFFNRDTAGELQAYYESRGDCDENPFTFAFNCPGRSYAHWSERDEYSVVFQKQYTNKFSEGTLAHELLHQFGARDYYFPDWIEELAKAYCPNSIMLSSSNSEVDELSAYLVGWKDSLSAKTLNFLRQTLRFTEEEYDRAYRIDDEKNGRCGKT